jgi:hypothetical protein
MANSVMKERPSEKLDITFGEGFTDGKNFEAKSKSRRSGKSPKESDG